MTSETTDTIVAVARIVVRTGGLVLVLFAMASIYELVRAGKGWPFFGEK